MDTIFAKIISREVPADIMYETDQVVAFRDINPQAPVHVLVVPKKWVKGIESATSEDDLQSLLLAAAEVARIEGVERSGYRLVINSGQHGGQTVDHLHVHVLGGRPMAWPPG
ncbi:histidine triad nucleotide-binding protein [Fimbriimonadia bacterium ATM]|nr:MAG: histidine triad nucleotide-binding protein [Armatimonadota bacterium]MBC6969162.1 histidine triad nucleotide-binding protein [Armatimonadota bacterium]MCE7900394.1 histidine triad nucleotide-binding protein [Armatimonadetes bacterium ATM1]MDL1928285.1 histidine triad nucleotide-binding protein [Fimbriimonadia bacterium ATM]RIJ97647.1 MAG: histidine triad nucleotide-binding protein [Armatimonadota bacterium]